MPETSTYFLFLVSSLVLIIAPGPDVVFTITQGILRGAKGGIAAAIGFGFGNIVHILAASLGVSIIFKNSPIVFTVFKIIGALYLFYLAYQSYSSRNKTAFTQNTLSDNTLSLHLFSKAFFMNVVNPKVALFFLAFFPQFIDANGDNVPLQFLIFGASFVILVILIFSIFGYFASFLGNWFRQNSKIEKRLNIISAVVFVAIGLFFLLL